MARHSIGHDADALEPPAAAGSQTMRRDVLCEHADPHACEAMSVVIILTSCPDAASAAHIARVLVDERLAACVQAISGVVSTYRWQGAVRTDNEIVLQIKTTKARLAALKVRLPELHPYEVPELVVLEAVDGLPDYLKWVNDEIR